MNPNADRLAKSLQHCLSQALDGLTRLRKLGWFELLQDDWPQTEIAWQVACEALFHLAMDSESRWDGNTAIIIGILNFLKQQTGRSLSARDLQDLKQMLQSMPVPRRDVEHWFEMIYG